MLNDIKARWLVITVAMDISLTVLALILARYIRNLFPGSYYLDQTLSFSLLDRPLHFPLAALIPVVVIIWLIVFSALSIYDARFTPSQLGQIQPVLVAVTGSTLVLAGLAYFFFSDLSRFLFLYFYLLDTIFLTGWRRLIFSLLQEKTLQGWQPKHHILIVGQGQLVQDVVTAIQAFAWSGLEMVGCIEPNPNVSETALVEEITRSVKQYQVDEIIFALPPRHQRLLQKLVFQLQPMSVNLRLVPDVIDLVFVQATIEDFAGLPLIGLRQPAINIFDRLVKRTFDIVLTGLLLVLLSPFMAIIVLLIKLDSDGPVFYLSKRVGEGGKIFGMFKFRTMKVDADNAETDLLVRDNGTIGFNKDPNDPRVTQFGRFLRRTSLDELPQLINVLKGDMSLVGPRPELPWLVEYYEPWQYQRFVVPQGITGWWQVKNRHKQKEYNVRVEDDLYYIHNYSFLLDLRILMQTVSAIIHRDGAF